MWMELLIAIIGIIGIGLAFILVMAAFFWIMNKIDPPPGFRRK